MRKKLLASAVGLALTSQINAQGLTDRLIIKYKNGASPVVTESPDYLRELSSVAGVTLQHRRYMYDGAQILVLDKKVSDRELAGVIENIKTRDDIEFVEEDKLMQTFFTPNDQHYQAAQWHYHEAVGGINVESAWDITSGAGVTIAVIDTGITAHPDLDANIVGGYDMISDTFVSNDGDGRDADPSDPGDRITTNECPFPNSARDSTWHGTHVAGTIAAVTDNTIGVAGIAFNAQVVPVRVLGKCGGYTSDIADGIVWASGGNVAGVPANPNPASVINLSLGGQGACPQAYQNAIDAALANDSVLVIASGNSQSDVSGFQPANCDDIISVAATNRQADRASYSNFGALIDIAAPGGEGAPNGVASTINDGTDTPGNPAYAYNAGTSMAAPHVAGVAGLMKSVNNSLTPAEIETAIKNTARPFPGGSSCNTSNCGDGILDAFAAVTAVNVGSNAQLTSNTPSLDVCASSDSAAFNLTLTDFDATTNMSGTGCPAGAVCSFSNNPVVSPTTTTDFNVTGLGSVAANSYNLVATGTDSVDGNITDSVNLVLNVSDVLGTPGLVTPADGSTNVNSSPTLTWNALPGALTYDVEVATDAGFSNIVDFAIGLNGTSHTVATPLNGLTEYYWRVTATNGCGDSVSNFFIFTTANEVCTVYSASDLPLPISAGAPPNVVTSTLTIADSGSIIDVNVVNFTGTHTWVGDVLFDLESPSGTIVSLRDRACGNNDDWDIEYDDEAASATSPCPPTDGEAYQPVGLLSDFNGTDLQGDWLMTVEDEVNQDGGSFNSWGLEICYTPVVVNTAPVANIDNPSTDEDTLVSVDVLGNDTDAEGDSLSVTSCGAASNGNVVQNGNNCDYTPNQDYNGSDSFTYDISDGNGGSDTGTVNVTVNAINDVPAAADNNSNVNEDSSVSVDVLAGDSDADGDNLTVTSCGAASNGNVVQNGNNCDYTPDADYNGADSYTYSISDGNGGTDSATVNVTVASVNDQPSMTLSANTHVALSDIGNNPSELVACQFNFGPANESGQTVSDMVVGIQSDVDGILNSVDVDNNGNISYSFTGQTGVAQVTVALQDDGGTANGGVDTSQTQTINVHVQDYIFHTSFETEACQ